MSLIEFNSSDLVFRTPTWNFFELVVVLNSFKLRNKSISLRWFVVISRHGSHSSMFVGIDGSKLLIFQNIFPLPP